MRRPRFRLRTLLIAVTMLALWLGWNATLVKQRKQWLQIIQNRDFAVTTFQEGNAAASQETKHRIAPYALEAMRIRNRGEAAYGPKATGDISWTRRLLGDEAVWSILVDSSFAADADHIDQLRESFPEATIVVTDSLESLHRESQELVESLSPSR